MSDIPAFEPEPMAPGLIAGCLLSLAIITAIAGWSILSDDQSFDADQKAHIHSGVEFPKLSIDTQKLRDSRIAHYGEPDLETIDAEIDQLVGAFREANRAQFPSHTPEEPTAPEQLTLLIEILAGQIASVTRADGFQVVGQPLFERCMQGLDELLSAIESGNLPMSQALNDPPAERFSAYRENCGNFLPALKSYDVVSSDGQWLHPQGPVLVDILQRYRWADLVRKNYPLHTQLSDYELQLFYQWRIESVADFRPEQRKQFLTQATPFLPADYDTALARARLDVLGQDLDQVVERFQQLRDEYPDNDFYQAVAAEVERQARTNQL